MISGSSNNSPFGFLQSLFSNTQFSRLGKSLTTNDQMSLQTMKTALEKKATAKTTKDEYTPSATEAKATYAAKSGNIRVINEALATQEPDSCTGPGSTDACSTPAGTTSNAAPGFDSSTFDINAFYDSLGYGKVEGTFKTQQSQSHAAEAFAEASDDQMTAKERRAALFASDAVIADGEYAGMVHMLSATYTNENGETVTNNAYMKEDGTITYSIPRKPHEEIKDFDFLAQSFDDQQPGVAEAKGFSLKTMPGRNYQFELMDGLVDGKTGKQVGCYLYSSDTANDSVLDFKNFLDPAKFNGSRSYDELNSYLKQVVQDIKDGKATYNPNTSFSSDSAPGSSGNISIRMQVL